MHQNFHYPIQLFSLFNEKFCSLVTYTGRMACFDEKKKECPSNYKYARCPKRKWCHWISQLAITAPISGLPFLMKAIPITYVKAHAYTDEPYNNLGVSDILMVAEADCDIGTTIVFDSHYMDFAAKKKLVENDRKFIAKANPSWWKALVNKAKLDLGDTADDYVVLWSTELEMHFMVYNSISRKGKIKNKCVLTNAFVNLDPPSKKEHIPINTIKLSYQEYFNTNDVFNHFLHKRYFPIKQRTGWQANYTDFIFASYQMNLFTLYHEMLQLTDQMGRKEFTGILYRELIDLAVLVEDRPPEREKKISS